VFEPGRAREGVFEQVVDDVHDPLTVLAQQLAVRAHGDLRPALRDRDGDADRGAVDAEQLVGDLRDHVAMVVAHVAHGRDAHAALRLHVGEAGRAVFEPFRGHAVVAQVVEHFFRLGVARELLEHPEVEWGRAMEERARVRVDAEGGGGAALGTELVEEAEGGGHHGHER
jgi:hypothetical protein